MSWTPTTPIVKELFNYFCENPDFKAAFELSFKKARAINLKEWKEYGIGESVYSYFDYMDKYVLWVPSENVCGKNVYNHICIFYFILDLPPLRDYQSPIHPSSRGPWTWLSEWLIKYAKEMGKWMEEPGSITEECIETFVESPAYRDKGVSSFYEQYPRKEWKSFNEFFAREINLTLRPIASPSDPTVIVCPADCAFGGKWDIRDGPIVHLGEPDVTCEVKGIPWSIRQLLDDGSHNFHPLFSGGVFTHAFLSPTNYHRLHAPVSGKVIQANIIPGLCYLEVEVEEVESQYSTGPPEPRLTMRRRLMPKDTVFSSESAGGDDNKQRRPVAPNSPGYQFLQAPKSGLVAVLPIGMAQVSSVVLSVKEGDTVKKGQEIAFFQLGGSDVVMVFEKDANVNLDDWKNRPECQPGSSTDPNCESFTKYGCKIGTAQLIPK
ncbi:hypothetical protein V8D89_010241 [Ganoderma adspersum]